MSLHGDRYYVANCDENNELVPSQKQNHSIYMYSKEKYD